MNLILSIAILAFQVTIISYFQSYIDLDDFESPFLLEQPFYDFELSETDIYDKRSLTFFEFLGRERDLLNGTKEEYDHKYFKKIFGQQFLYKDKNRNYFFYKNQYSVNLDQNCPSDHKKCGVLDSNQRILCLPINEQCPLNGFGISKSYPDNKYKDYKYKKVYDSIDNSVYYLYYTNNNPEGIIITEFKLSHGTPCAKNSEINWVKVYENEVQENFNCHKKVNNALNSNEYLKVSDEGINIMSLYKDNGLTESSSYADINDYKIDLYVRNFNELNEVSVEETLNEIKDNKNNRNVKSIVIIILASISIIFIFVLDIIMFSMCCYGKKFRAISFISPACNIISNIIYLIIADGDTTYDSLNIVFPILSLFFSILSLVYTVSIKVMNGKKNSDSSSTVMNPNPASLRDIPTPNPGNLHYQNIMHSPSGDHVIHSKRKKKS